MNYRHSYHAGNFTDVFKHVLLIALLKALKEKETPFCYLDTHAGAGLYDLQSSAPQKTKEYKLGISRVAVAERIPALISGYLKAVQACNEDKNNLRFYPGSPKIARYFLRSQDRMIITELHTEEYRSLKQLFFYDKQTAVHSMDGYAALKAFLPPKEKRGLILIDPPYEEKNEYEKIISGMENAAKQFPQGVYAIWYPIKADTQAQQLYDSLGKLFSKILLAELMVHPSDTLENLNGCGMIIINPPWQIEKQLQSALVWLRDVLGISGEGNYRLKQL